MTACSNPSSIEGASTALRLEFEHSKVTAAASVVDKAIDSVDFIYVIPATPEPHDPEINTAHVRQRRKRVR